MTKPLSVLEQARHDAQDLHRKISANIARTEAATWADVKAAQTDTLALAARMKTLAADQAGSLRSGLSSAVAKMENAGKTVEKKAKDTGDSIAHANAALLESAHRAAQSLSQAVAAMRNKAAIAPATGAKKVTP